MFKVLKNACPRFFKYLFDDTMPVTCKLDLKIVARVESTFKCRNNNGVAGLGAVLGVKGMPDFLQQTQMQLQLQMQQQLLLQLGNGRIGGKSLSDDLPEPRRPNLQRREVRLPPREVRVGCEDVAFDTPSKKVNSC